MTQPIKTCLSSSCPERECKKCHCFSGSHPVPASPAGFKGCEVFEPKPCTAVPVGEEKPHRDTVEGGGDGSVRCCDNGDMDEKHECLKSPPAEKQEAEGCTEGGETPWEVEFDRMFRAEDFDFSENSEQIKSFIAQTRKESFDAGYEKAYEEATERGACCVKCWGRGWIPVPPFAVCDCKIGEEYEDVVKEAEKKAYNSPCEGCPEGHPSFWKTIVESKEWKEWEKVANEKGFDYDESRECGWFGKAHFAEFLKFCGKEAIEQEQTRIMEKVIAGDTFTLLREYKEKKK